MKIYLHIGAGKCGSSALQSYFSYNSDFTYRKCYAIIGIDGTISTGESILRTAKTNAFDYASSASFNNSSNENLFISNFRSSLDKLSTDYDEVLFSNEGWLEESQNFLEKSPIFENHIVEVIFIVRPPVEWINSAWWQWGQWGQWGKGNLNGWIHAQLSKTQWIDYYNKWNSLQFVSKVHTYSLSSDILKELSRLIEFKYSSSPQRHNNSSDYRLLRFFKLARSLRKNEHTPNIEFSLNRHITSTGTPDWILSRDNIGKILSSTKESNLKIRDLISNEDITTNDKWWGNGYYKDIDKDLKIDAELSKESLIKMLEEAYLIIHDLDMKIRRHHKQHHTIE